MRQELDHPSSAPQSPPQAPEDPRGQGCGKPSPLGGLRQAPGFFTRLHRPAGASQLRSDMGPLVQGLHRLVGQG